MIHDDRLPDNCQEDNNLADLIAMRFKSEDTSKLNLLYPDSTPLTELIDGKVKTDILGDAYVNEDMVKSTLNRDSLYGRFSGSQADDAKRVLRFQAYYTDFIEKYNLQPHQQDITYFYPWLNRDIVIYSRPMFNHVIEHYKTLRAAMKALKSANSSIVLPPTTDITAVFSVIYSLCLSYGNSAYCSYSFISDELDISPKTVQRAVKVLLDDEFIILLKQGTLIKRGIRLANVYAINSEKTHLLAR